MRFLSICFLLAFLCSATRAQQDTGNTGTGGVTAGTVTNTGGTGNQAAGGGSSARPEGFGSGGVSENVNNAAFGERGTVIQGFGDITRPEGAFGQIQTGNAAGNRGQFGNVGGFGAGGRGGQQVQRNVPRRIRTQLKLPADFAIEYRTIPATKLQNSLSQQYRGIDASQARSKMPLGSSRVFAGAEIEVSASGRIVTLRGQVGSDRERKLAERIARFEPGVDRVVNQLSVVESKR